MFQLGKFYIDMNDFDKRIQPIKKSDEIAFRRKGGIIETNDVQQLISSVWSKRKNAIVIIPASMSNIWEHHTQSNIVIAHEDLPSFGTKQFKAISSNKIDRILVHECSEEFLPCVKKFMKELDKYMKVKKVWIINSLPLIYYTSEFNDSAYVTFKEQFTFVNLWLSCENKFKETSKTELMKMLRMNFHKMYSTVIYPKSIVKCYQTKFNSLESSIWSNCLKHFNNWSQSLTNELDNIYSWAPKLKVETIKHKLFNSVIVMALSTTSEDQGSDILKCKIKTTMNAYDKVLTLIQKDIIQNVKADQKGLAETIVNNQDLIKTIDKNMNLQKRYEAGPIKTDSSLALECTVCGTSEATFSKLVCGHVFCVECIIDSLALANKCPNCRDYANISKLVITHDEQSVFRNYISNLSAGTVIVTDIPVLSNIESKASIAYIPTDCFEGGRKQMLKFKTNLIQGLKVANEIVYVSSPDHPMNAAITKIIGHASLFNSGIAIKKLTYVLN